MSLDRCSVYGVMEDHGAYREIFGLEVYEEDEQIIVGWHEMFTSLPVEVGSVFGSYQALMDSGRKTMEVR